ncbi:DDE-type integrase/transposase/recombinase [Serratia proteamaculans]|uniref:DDE-type integrase/transposase/recombinase n=1 Tax=Serratia proteamaculans TaxID=28151 RepID=A0A5Q2VCC5_SERPR|nr:DDE-type integrase/transposase/recombinase [Serratia proteamaculans]QGH62018.1 DDE-type integrase/transposase/recombinase [Serratia proteamaculans]
MSLIQNAFKRLHYPIDVITQCVRWYLADSLSLRNLEEMMVERGIVVGHSTLHCWVIRLVPNLVEQDHRNIKRRIRQMLGFKSFRLAQTLLVGIELIHMIRKGHIYHPAVDRLSVAEQFYLLAAKITATLLLLTCCR